MGHDLFQIKRKGHRILGDVSRSSTLMVLFLSLVLSACISSKYSNQISYVNADTYYEGQRFIDSLKANNVNTIVGYYSGCVDCSRHSPRPYYVFWNLKDSWFTTKFTRTKRYRTIEGHAPPLLYVSRNIDSLRNVELVKPQMIKSAYGYEEVVIMLQDENFRFNIRHYEKENNMNNHRVILTDSIRSLVSSIPDLEWRALNY